MTVYANDTITVTGGASISVQTEAVRPRRRHAPRWLVRELPYVLLGAGIEATHKLPLAGALAALCTRLVDSLRDRLK